MGVPSTEEREKGRAFQAKRHTGPGWVLRLFVLGEAGESGCSHSSRF